MNLTTLKSKARLYTLAFALISPFLVSSFSFTAEPQEAEALKILQEFLDIKKAGSFEQYARQLSEILKLNPNFAELSKTLYSIKNSKDQLAIASALKKFKTDPKIPASIKAELNRLSVSQMLTVLRTRLK